MADKERLRRQNARLQRRVVTLESTLRDVLRTEMADGETVTQLYTRALNVLLDETWKTTPVTFTPKSGLPSKK